MGMVPLPFEVEHRVHDVLEELRTGKTAILRHVPDQEGRNVVALRVEEQVGRRLPHLPYAPRR